MSQQTHYKRKELIDDDKESQLLSSILELAFEANSNGWQETVDTKNTSIEWKKHATTKRPIYRLIVKNQSAATMNEFYQYYQAGYNIWTHREILYHIDDNHDILYGKNEGMGPISGRDWQRMSNRFTMNDFISTKGMQYNVVGLLLYDIPKMHPLYIDPPNKYIRQKQECEAYIYYKPIGAADNKFVYVYIEFTLHAGGWMPNWIEDGVNYSNIKEEINIFYKACKQIPAVLERRKNNQIIRKKPALLQYTNNDEWMNIYQCLIQMGFSDVGSMNAAKLYPNNLNMAITVLNDNELVLNEKQKDNKLVDDDMVYHRDIVDTKKENIYESNDEKHDITNDEIMNIHPNIIDTIQGNESHSVYNQLMVNEQKEEILPTQSVKIQFTNFLQRANMMQFMDKFEENNCCDMESIELFDDEFLQNEISIKSRILRNKFLKKCKKMKHDMDTFKNECGINDLLYHRLEKYGVVTLNILCDEIKNKDDLKYKYKITNKNQSDFVWNLIQKYENQNNEQLEGN